MKLFGLNITWGSEAKDQVVVKTVSPSTTAVSKMPQIKIGALSYAQQFAHGRGNFISSEYDLAEIGKIEDTDSFVRQAFKKKEGLMFKEGVTAKGANKDTLRYYKTRMAQIARATGIPEIALLKRTARSLIRTSNAFLIKVRNEAASGGKTRQTPNGKTLKPVAGYFPVAPETMRVDIDQNTGKIVKWKQILPDGRWREFGVDDVIHFHIDRREGFTFGVPTIVPAIDDIRALRQIEENIELLLYQHIFPLFHYKVGTETAPAGYTEEGVREVDAVQDQIRLMPSEGALVTPERHEIQAIGAEGRAIRAEGYLEHFKKRVFAGLGISQVDVGDGDTTNRATANTMSRALVDSVKAIQDDLEAQWDHHVISELLLESTFGERVLEEEQMVHLYFAEIDIQNKMELEQHAVELWKNNGITYDEFRALLGYEPIIIPEDPSDQDMKKYPEWSMTYWKLIEEPTNMIRSSDEPYSPLALAAAESRSVAVTSQSLETAKKAREEQANQAAQRQSNQIAAQQNNQMQRQDNFLSTAFDDFEVDTTMRLESSIESRGIVDTDYLLSFARAWGGDTAKQLSSFAYAEFLKGFNDETGGLPQDAEVVLSVSRTTINDRIDFYIDRLVTDTIALISRRVDDHLSNVTLSEAKSNAISQLRIAFDAVRYRTNFIWDVEVKKAYNFGRVTGMKFTDSYGIELQAHPDGCKQCRSLHGKVISADLATIENMPPYHPNSRMTFKVKKETDG